MTEFRQVRELAGEPATTDEQAWYIPRAAGPWHIIGSSAVFLPILIVKIVTAFNAGGSQVDTAFTILASVFGGFLLLILAVGVAISIGVTLRTRTLARLHGSGKVFLSYNLLHFRATLHATDSRVRIPMRGLYSLAIESDRISVWVGARRPKLIAEIAADQIESIDRSAFATAKRGVSLWLAVGGSRFVLPVQLRNVSGFGSLVDRRQKLDAFVAQVTALKPGATGTDSDGDISGGK